MKTVWAFIVLLQILSQVGFAEREHSNEMAGVAGNTVVRNKDNQQVLVSSLKDGDVVMGLKGYDRSASPCTVVSTIAQGATELAGNFSYPHMLYTDNEIRTHMSNEPSIHGLQDFQSFEIISDCELIQAETPNGVSYFSPLSSVFCGSSKISWYDYYVLFGTLAEIVTKTGTFWIDIRNYKDCVAGPTCTVPSWKAALPPICTSMKLCAINKEQATCDSLNTLAHAFVKEHLPVELQTKFATAYPTLGKDVMARVVPEKAGKKKWWEHLMFWKWKVWKFDWVNFEINWRSPLTITILVCICIAINGFIAICVMQCMKDEGDISYHSFESQESGDERDYETGTHTRTHTHTADYDDGY